MAVDPKHKRDIPTGRKIAATVELALLGMRKQSVDAVRMGQVIPPYYNSLWSLYRQLIPEFSRYMIVGATYSLLHAPKLNPPYFTKADAIAAFTPFVRVESERQVMNLIREINETTRKEFQRAITAGMAAGEPLSRIQANIMGVPAPMTVQDRVAELKVFEKPRAEVIGSDAATRAMFTGQAEMGKRNGSLGLTWGISDGACEVCKSLDGEKRRHGEWFYEWPNAPPGYRYVFSSPAHPNCKCDCQDWWPDQ